MSIDNAVALSPTIRVAAVQMTAEFADVDANLAKAERLVRMAFERGANWVILPELFASGNAFHPQMAKTTRAIDGSPAELLRDLARQGNATVGGSFLAWRDGNVYNSFVKHPGFDAHLFSCDRCAFRSGGGA
jgi:predicted amidohydrolase